MATKNFIFACGFDYAFKGNSFVTLANNRMKAAIQKNKSQADSLHFTLFDFKEGKIIQHGLSGPGWKPATTETTPFQAVARADYARPKGPGHSSLKPDSAKSKKFMSILDVYKTVQAIGQSSPGTLQELSMFSHGWVGGAIFLNTHESESAKSSGLRDPLDADARAKDFELANMPQDSASNFKKAYAENAINWLWGCAFPKVTHGLLHKITNHPAYKRYRGGPIPDDTVFRFTNLNDDEKAELAAGLGLDVTLYTEDPPFSPEFEKIKLSFTRLNQSVYAHHLAGASGRTTYAAAVGTYSGFDQGKSGALMNVSKTVGPYIDFYKRHLKFEFDPEGRRYAKYPTPNP